jgi:hypothetical protein
MSIKFGGKNLALGLFFDAKPNLVLSPLAVLQSPKMRTFLRTEYIEQGGRSVVGMTPEQLQDIRLAAKGALDAVSDLEIEYNLRFITSRTRIYAHLERLREGYMKWAYIVRNQYCGDACQYFHGKYFNAQIAYEAMQKLMSLKPEGQAAFLERSNISRETPDWLSRVTAGLKIPDSLIAERLLIPPFYSSDACRIEGLVPIDEETDKLIAKLEQK